MGIKFTVHTDGMDAVKYKLIQGCSKAEHILAIQVMKDTAPFVPMRSGSLNQRTHTEGYTENDFGPGAGSMIVYPGPYARNLYCGKLMVDPRTGSPFAPKGGTKVLTDRNLVFMRDHHPQAQSHWFEASKAQNLDKWLRIAGKLVKNGGNS